MFCGQNCSGRFGENKSIISVAGSKEDINFVRLFNELKLRKIKRELNQKYFSIAAELAIKYSIKVSIVIVQNNKYGEWKSMLYQYPNWFGKLYGIVCKKALEQVKDKSILLHMDREYDSKTLGFAADTICGLLNLTRDDIYIRKEREYPTNRIMAADLFARGCFKGYDCSQFSIIKPTKTKGFSGPRKSKIFSGILTSKMKSKKCSEKPANDKCLGTVSLADMVMLGLVLFKPFVWKVV